MDISIGVADRVPPDLRRFGLIAGIVASLGYMAGAAILTPDLWIEPLGALVKTGPAIVLMLVALLTWIIDSVFERKPAPDLIRGGNRFASRKRVKNEGFMTPGPTTT